MSENRETTISGKLRRFLIEGFLLRKISKKILTPVDFWLGTFARNIMAKKTPVNPKKIIFITFQNQYTCNPKYICEELLHQNLDCEIVWTTDLKAANVSAGFPENATVVQVGSEEFYRELASAKLWVANSVDFLKRPMNKKKDQIFIETWHGSLGIKKFDKGANSGKGWVRAAQLTTKICDYLVSNSDFENDVYRDSFWKEQTIWKYGHPRNDVLVNGNNIPVLKKKIYKKYSIPEDARICLYAPTFRDSHTFTFYNVDYDKLKSSLEEKFGGNWYIIQRFHPTVSKYVNADAVNEEDLPVKDATYYPDMQELIEVADVGITDYSSWIFDFVLTRRPGFIFAEDMDSYYDERGYYYSLYETPFAVCKNNDDLVNAIAEYDEKEYLEKVDAFLCDKGCVDDGHASEKVVAEIVKLLNLKVKK